jgi:polyvinyl alcohol dehydrogenase (cytochrome)
MKNNRLTASLFIGLAAFLSGHEAAADWPMFGWSIFNTADNVAESIISRTNVSRLKPKWIATVGGDVSARPAVVGGVVYFPDWGGNLQALDAATGTVVWQNQLSAYGLPAKTVARSSPAVVNGTLYIGALTGAWLLAVDAATGTLKWKTSLDTHPHAILTGSPTVSNGVIYIGVASTEEGVASLPGYQCCSFRGSVVAVSATTGAILWKSFMVPPNYSGGAVWGSNPVVDLVHQSVIVGTGNNYATATDPAYQACIANGKTEAQCLSPADHLDSVLALDVATGKVKWAKRLWSTDDWNTACQTDMPGTGNCPTGAGPDYDFGSAPNEFAIGQRTVVGIGQKSGIYSAFDIDTGQIIWSRWVGPGSSLGGMMWGSASDGTRIYVSIGDASGKAYAGGTAGSWAALDAVTGAVLWRTQDPHGAVDIAPMTATNGVVYAGSMGAGAGWSNMLALDATTGKILWKFPSGGSVIAGAVVSDGVVYWGSGYSHFGPQFKGNNKFYAFSIDGK